MVGTSNSLLLVYIFYVQKWMKIISFLIKALLTMDRHLSDDQKMARVEQVLDEVRKKYSNSWQLLK